jgi:group I intron endonuclease
MLQKSGIYRILNTVNGKPYLGSAVIIPNRWREHTRTLRKGTHKNPHLQAAWNKYGEEAFIFEIVELIEDKNKLIEREQYWIDFYEAYNPQKGYNVCQTAGNTSGRTFSPETRLKMNEIKKVQFLGENNPFFGKQHTDAAKERNRKAHIGVSPPNKGKHISQKQKDILREAAIKRWQNPKYREHQRQIRLGKPAWNKGIPATTEAIEILRQSRLGQSSWNKGLTKETDPRMAKISESIKKTLKEKTKGE